MHNKTLNRYYFIKKFNQSHIDKQDKKTIIIFRNYDQEINKKLILTIKNYCKKKGNKFLISNNIKLAKKKFIILGSAHNIFEMRTKELQGVNAIFLSSIFKKNKNYLGMYRFKSLSLLCKKSLIALGGISTNNLKKLNLTGCVGFAGISFFEQKKGP
jgi:thiamine-phosphate pyrophosphorylase